MLDLIVDQGLIFLFSLIDSLLNHVVVDGIAINFYCSLVAVNLF